MISPGLQPLQVDEGFAALELSGTSGPPAPVSGQSLPRTVSRHCRASPSLTSLHWGSEQASDSTLVAPVPMVHALLSPYIKIVRWWDFARSWWRGLRSADRRLREARMFARAMVSKHHPILIEIFPIRRCDLACTYCSEFDAVSKPVPLPEMLRRVDLLAGLGATIITISGGEPMRHPELDDIIRHILRQGAIATLITNVYLLTPEGIVRLNRAGLDYLQIGIDKVNPDSTSKKGLKVLDRKLECLAGHTDFAVTTNSVLGRRCAIRGTRASSPGARASSDSPARWAFCTMAMASSGPSPRIIWRFTRTCSSRTRRCSPSRSTTVSSGTSRKTCRIAGIATQDAAFSISVRTGWCITVPSCAAAPVYCSSTIPVPTWSANRKVLCAVLHNLVRAPDTHALHVPRKPLAGTGEDGRRPPRTQPHLPAACAAGRADAMFLDGPLKQVLRKAALRLLRARS